MGINAVKVTVTVIHQHKNIVFPTYRLDYFDFHRKLRFDHTRNLDCPLFQICPQTPI